MLNPMRNHGNADEHEDEGPEREIAELDYAKLSPDLKKPPDQDEDAKPKAKPKAPAPSPPAVFDIHIMVLILHLPPPIFDEKEGYGCRLQHCPNLA